MRKHPFFAAALTLALCLVSLFAMADQGAANPIGDVSGSAASIGATFNRIEGSTATPLQRGFKSMTLAQLEDQLRRPEIKESIGKGSIAVLYPNVGEPFRSAYAGMIQGIEERTRLRVRSYPVDPK